MPETERVFGESSPESGVTLPEPSKLSGRELFFSKTLLPSAVEVSPKSPKTWPRSGMTSGGRVYELPTWAQPTDGTAGSDSPALPPRASDGPHGDPNQRNSRGGYDALPGAVVNLLPTPTASNPNDGESLESWEARRQRNKAKGINGNGQGTPLAIAVRLLPTPTARDWKSGASNLHGVNSRPLGEVAILFPTPTPTRSDGTGGPGTSLNRVGGMNLRTAVASVAQDWGEFTPAVQRHEQLVGRPAPLPTEVGPRGGRRLSAPFAEWLMGLPDGWVTGVPGLTRSQQLQAIGNGVVPQQAEAAFKHLMTNWIELKGPDHE